MTKKILIVEDDVLLARQLSSQLSRAGYQVRQALHAGEAMVAIDDDLPDVVVLDMLLPVNSGMALLHELQSYGDTASLPVIVCTSLADSVNLEDLKVYGVKRLIDKTTMHPKDLIGAIRAVTL